MIPSKLSLINAKIVTPVGTIDSGYVVVSDGRIQSVGPMTDWDAVKAAAAGGAPVDAEGQWLLPGFIDVHVHGGFGYDFMDAEADGLTEITRFHAKHGTTTMLATTVTASYEALAGVLARVNAYRQNDMPYAQLAGVHLEGPFISHKWPGAQNPAFIVPPQLPWLKEWTAQYPGLVRLLTLAPETEGANELIAWVTGQGITAACGHTDSTYEQIAEAVRHGLKHAVHTFNAMTGLHHRKPGVVGAVMDLDAIRAEVIADGHHVHPAAIRVLARAKGPDNLLLITDAMSAAGLGNGDYSLGGLKVTVSDGVARLKEGDSLAGSTLTMLDAFHFMVGKVGLDIPTVSRMASLNPARALGAEQELGSIEPGKMADLLLLSSELELKRSWIRGRELELV